jgi:hypothetical protein
MAQQLEFPDLVWENDTSRLGMEVSIDFLPAEYAGDWHRAVHAYMADWVKKKSFKKSATLWMWGCISVNLIYQHPKNPVPSWSDFIVQFGLTDHVIEEMTGQLTDKFAGQVRMQYLHPVRDEGWVAICHIEQGSVWTKVDADVWEVFAEPKKLGGAKMKKRKKLVRRKQK